MIEMIVKYVCIALICLASSSLKAQDLQLSGKWQLLEMQQDSLIIFHRDDAEITIEQARSRQKPLDSLEIMRYREVTHPMMKKMYYEFLTDGNINAGVLDLKDEEYIFIEKTGVYYLDGERLGISISGNNDSYIYSLNENILTLIPIIGEAIYQRGYAKYEWIE